MVIPKEIKHHSVRRVTQLETDPAGDEQTKESEDAGGKHDQKDQHKALNGGHAEEFTRAGARPGCRNGGGLVFSLSLFFILFCSIISKIIKNNNLVF